MRDGWVRARFFLWVVGYDGGAVVRIRRLVSFGCGGALHAWLACFRMSGLLLDAALPSRFAWFGTSTSVLDAAGSGQLGLQSSRPSFASRYKVGVCLVGHVSG